MTTIPISIPAGCNEIGDCQVVPPYGSRTVQAKAYEDINGVEKAIDGAGQIYSITYAREAGQDPIFTPLR